MSRTTSGSGFETSFLIPPKPAAPPILGGTRGLSGAERLMAKNAPLVAWLAKVYREMSEDRKRAKEEEGREDLAKSWPCFDYKGLGGFLTVLGVDLSGPATKSATTATHEMPPDLGAPEGCVKALQGAPFLTGDPRSVCDQLARRRAMARL